MLLKMYIDNRKIEDWITAEHYKESSILMILKKNLGCKNQKEIEKKTKLYPSFLRLKLCWKTDQEYSEITQILNGIIGYFEISDPCFYSGRELLDFVVAPDGSLDYVSYHKSLEKDGTKSLLYWTIDKTIERWIKEKF